jgi:hypothetical protein
MAEVSVTVARAPVTTKFLGQRHDVDEKSPLPGGSPMRLQAAS